MGRDLTIFMGIDGFAFPQRNAAAVKTVLMKGGNFVKEV
jgi:hypothetical protein